MRYTDFIYTTLKRDKQDVYLKTNDKSLPCKIQKFKLKTEAHFTKIEVNSRSILIEFKFEFQNHNYSDSKRFYFGEDVSPYKIRERIRKYIDSVVNKKIIDDFGQQFIDDLTNESLERIRKRFVNNKKTVQNNRR
ncbi:hypothetical protein BPT24_001 [Tenacibaculum phage pT24]|uniref:Uncharacterized protein n=1 Tax=Tenacibaculum phage pT24 TaxID=1880590 RepID=A0A1B4XWC9_9CAUD|nr:hypothetical protein HYP10_gp001 [Tenacibaculum phage pT24]BAV39123.1 hypothetical protein BPT24_001 [Tenacibaculum phage pT24]